jgi:hypothetical protein
VAPAISAQRWIIQVVENLSSSGGGYVGGTTLNVGPTTHGHFGGGSHAAVVGNLGILDIKTNTFVSLLDFDTGNKLLDIQASSLPMSFERMFLDQVYWQGNSGRVNDVGRWTADAGAIEFVNYGFDPNHAAGDLGTDESNMVWLEGHGAQTDAGPYTTMDYWTSPFAAEPAQLQPRRLRSELTTSILGTPIAVGCGFASYANGYGVRVIRINDGWSWYLANVTGWAWNQALAVTCGELFVRVAISGPIYTLARVPLNQLGTGIAPD